MLLKEHCSQLPSYLLSEPTASRKTRFLNQIQARTARAACCSLRASCSVLLDAILTNNEERCSGCAWSLALNAHAPAPARPRRFRCGG